MLSCNVKGSVRGRLFAEPRIQLLGNSVAIPSPSGAQAFQISAIAERWRWAILENPQFPASPEVLEVDLSLISHPAEDAELRRVGCLQWSGETPSPGNCSHLKPQRFDKGAAKVSPNPLKARAILGRRLRPYRLEAIS